MTGYLLRRIGQALIVVVLVSLIVFVLLRLLPGGPARAILGPGATQEQVVQFNREQGFEQPIPLQYLSYAVRVGQATSATRTGSTRTSSRSSPSDCRRRCC